MAACKIIRFWIDRSFVDFCLQNILSRFRSLLKEDAVVFLKEGSKDLYTTFQMCTVEHLFYCWRSGINIHTMTRIDSEQRG